MVFHVSKLGMAW